MVFAEYILALLKHEKEERDLKEELVSQLSDFMGESAPFVDYLFGILRERTYLLQMKERSRSRSRDRRYHNQDKHGRENRSRDYSDDRFSTRKRCHQFDGILNFN